MFESMLKLNPYLRVTARECLSNSIFDPYRNSIKESIINEMYIKRQDKDQNISNQYQIHLEVDAPNVVDYNNA